MPDTPPPTPAQNFVVVLNRPQDVVNIAGTMRAMMNMGFERLRLVAPDEFDAYRIGGIAHGSEDLIERVEFFDTLADALSDAGAIVGTTARRRTSTYVWQRPREAAGALLARLPALDGPVALVFGREDKGLSNEDLDLCDLLLVIPTDPAHSSLNLAQAVLLVLYDLAQAMRDTSALPQPKRRSGLARPTQLQQVFADIEDSLETIEFFKARNGSAIMRTVRAILRRAMLTEREARLVRAMAIEVRKYIDRRIGES